MDKLVEDVARALYRADLDSDQDKPLPPRSRRNSVLCLGTIYTEDAKAAIREVAEALERDLALTELANVEGASADWLDGFRAAVARVTALKEALK